MRYGGQFLSSPPLSPQCYHQVPICCWVNSERAFSQGIESDSNRRPSAREACALTTMVPRPCCIPKQLLIRVAECTCIQSNIINCYFCFVRRKIFTAKSNASIMYASLKSAIIPILHSNETYVPIVTDLLELCKADSDNDDKIKSQSTDCKD